MRLRKFDDMHLHLRQGEMLKLVLPYTLSQCARALVMPNTSPAVLTASDLTNYRSEILQAAGSAKAGFEPLMTFKITPACDSSSIASLKSAGAIAGKLYPDGVTTNSEGGVRDFRALFPVYDAMQEAGLVLCLHGELPGAFSIDREEKFLEVLQEIAARFTRLKIVLEHVTTAAAVACVSALPANVAATITLHHLYITLDDLLGDKLNPHNFCKPVAKRPEDREALIKAATSGSAKFFFGSDSAPHSIEAKECACGAAGVYSAPVLAPLLKQLFDDAGSDQLENFVSRFGADFYGLPVNQDFIELKEEEWLVPEVLDGIKPFMAGSRLRWRLV